MYSRKLEADPSLRGGGEEGRRRGLEDEGRKRGEVERT